MPNIQACSLVVPPCGLVLTGEDPKLTEASVEAWGIWVDWLTQASKVDVVTRVEECAAGGHSTKTTPCRLTYALFAHSPSNFHH